MALSTDYFATNAVLDGVLKRCPAGRLEHGGKGNDSLAATISPSKKVGGVRSHRVPPCGESSATVANVRHLKSVKNCFVERRKNRKTARCVSSRLVSQITVLLPVVPNLRRESNGAVSGVYPEKGKACYDTFTAQKVPFAVRVLRER